MGIVYLIRPACLKNVNRYEIGSCKQEDMLNKFEKHTELFCVLGSIENYNQAQKEVITEFDKWFDCVIDRFYEGDLQQMIDVFIKTIRLSEKRAHDIVEVQNIALGEVKNWYEKHAIPMNEIDSYIPVGYCGDFKKELNDAISKAKLKYKVSSAVTPTEISEFIRFQKPPLKFTPI